MPFFRLAASAQDARRKALFEAPQDQGRCSEGRVLGR
jgi:hypothetical protein